MSLRTIEGEGIRPETPLWRYMELSKFMMLLAGKGFIATLATLRKDADPKETIVASKSEDVPELLFSGEPGDDLRKWLRLHSPPGCGNAEPASAWSLTEFDEWLAHLGARRAVWCWGSTPDLRPTQEPWENLAMWNSYARSGVAIRTTFRGVEKAVAASGDLKAADGIALKVRYSWQGGRIPELFDDDRPDGPFLKRPFRPFAFKNKSYEFESEVRLVFRVNCQQDSPPGVVMNIDPSLLLDGGEVVVSPYMHADEAYALAAWIEWYLNNPRITVRWSAERSEADRDIVDFIAPNYGPYIFQRQPRHVPRAGEAGADAEAPNARADGGVGGDDLVNPQNQWLKRFEREDGLPDFLHEL